MVDNLAAIDEVVTSRDLILYGLGGLNGDYNSFASWDQTKYALKTFRVNWTCTFIIHIQNFWT